MTENKADARRGYKSRKQDKNFQGSIAGLKILRIFAVLKPTWCP